MERFQEYLDVRPNITYIAIGSAYSESGGLQQYPPFLQRLTEQRPDFDFEIILIDPMIEALPEIVKRTQGIRQFAPNHYGQSNLNIRIIRQKFEFDAILAGASCSSKEFLLTIVSRTIAAKQENPQNTYLLFVHDFSGHPIDRLSDAMWRLHSDHDDITKYIYQKNIMIDIGGLGPGCFVDMNSIHFHPILIHSTSGSLEIFNPIFLDDFDIYSILLQNFRNTSIKELVLGIVMKRLNAFANDVLPSYRQIRMLLEGKNNIMPVIDEGNSCLFEGIDPGDIAGITNNMLRRLAMITSFLDLFRIDNIRKRLFGPFVDICMQMPLDNHYQIVQVYKECVCGFEAYFIKVDGRRYYLEVYDYATRYTISNQKLPLFMQLMMQ